MLDDPSADSRVAEPTHKPALVLFPTASKDVQHHEIGVIGKLQIVELVSGEKRLK
jgi:hypothetical protein